METHIILKLNTQKRNSYVVYYLLPLPYCLQTINKEWSVGAYISKEIKAK